MSRKKAPAKYTLLKIGLWQYLLPVTVNKGALLTALSEAIEVGNDWGHETGDGYYIKNEELEISVSVIPASKVRMHKTERHSEEEETLRLINGRNLLNP